MKPGLKKLLLERGKEITKAKRGELNLLLLQQSYLVRKIQSGYYNELGGLKTVQLEIENLYKNDCAKVKLQARAGKIDNNESVRIYHHELRRKQIKRTSILKLDTGSGIVEGHDNCTRLSS